MRLRNIPGADDVVSNSPYCIQNQLELKGKWNAFLGNENPIHIEIGMGKGRFLMDLAAQNPDINYIGIERYTSVLLRAVQKITESPLPNVHFLCEDAANLPDIFAPEEVARIYLNFSDPWPKDRHARRRLTSHEFLNRYYQFLKKDGRLEFKTDNQDLFTFSLAEIDESATWNLDAYTRDLHNDPVLNEGNIMTEYEEKFSSMGNPICKLVASMITKDKTSTTRLYDADAYATEFEAKVLSCEEQKDKKSTTYAVILDQTLFFPEEGGQSPDKGTINGIEVCDVQIKKDIITHYLKKPLTVGDTVKGCIDWQHRFNNMQQHSGEHIFSGIVHNRFGYDNVGFHLSDQIVTMDFNGMLTQEDIDSVEWAVNEVISKNIQIIVSYPSKTKLANMEYRSKIEIEGQVRIVTVPGYDVCACCAPHVKRTGEIGMLKVMNVQNYKGGVRISILCGFRALAAFREKNQVVSDLMNILTTGQEKLVDTVSKMKVSNQDLNYQLSSVKQAMLEQKLNDISPDDTNVLLFESGVDAPVMRNVVNQLVESHPGICGVFSGNDEEGYSFIIGSKQIDCRSMAAALKEKLSARGGGSEQMIQGSVQAKAEDISKLCNELPF